MLMRIRQWLAPPAFEDEGKTRAAGLLNTLLLLLLAATILGTAIVLPLEPDEWVFNAVFGVLLTGLFLWFRNLVRKGRLQGVGYVLATVLWLSMTTLVLMGDGLRDSSVVGYFLVLTFVSLLLGGRGVLLYGILSAVTLTGMFIAELVGGLVITPAPTVGLADWMVINLVLLLTALLLRSAILSLDSTVTRLRENETALAESNRALQENTASLKLRTHELEHRTGQLYAITELGRVTTTLRDQESLYVTVPKLIVDRLLLDYVGLFMLDELEVHLVLRGCHGSAGANLPIGTTIPLDSESVLAQTFAAKEARIIAEADAAFPQTRSRLVLPVTVGTRKLGLLDLHSREMGAFDQADAESLQGLADQLGVAFENVSLFAETRSALETAQRAYGEISGRAWEELLGTAETPGFRSLERGVVPVTGNITPEIARALLEKQVVQVPGDAQRDHLLVLPILVRDTVIGVVDTYKPGKGAGWTAAEIALLQDLVEQLGVALESARLYQDTQRRALQERLIGEVTGRMRETLDLDTILRTAAREIGEVLDLHDVTIRLQSDERDERVKRLL